MSAIFVLIGASVIVASCFLIAFIWAVRQGQYDDTVTPSLRILPDDAGVESPGSKAVHRQGDKAHGA
jgi:cbb3-type cytochrome oxidase maturation protein